MKKERDDRRKIKRDQAPVKKGGASKKREKLRITGNTEILDLDLLQEEEKKTAPFKDEPAPVRKAASKAERARGAERKESKAAAKAYGEKMPKKPVSLSDETIELLELDEILGAKAQESGRAEAKADRHADEEKPRHATAGKARHAEERHEKGAGKKGKSHTYEEEEGRLKRRAASVRNAPERNKRGGFEFGVMDALVALTGVIVVVVAVAAFTIYHNASDVENQISAMAEVGEKLEGIGYAGEGILVAVADARIAAQELLEEEGESETPKGEEEGYEEKELVSRVNVGLKLSSVQKDLKIKFTNRESGKLIGNQAFTVKIDGPEPMTKTDDDRDGIIYINSIKAGEYTVTITAPEEIDGAKVAGTKAPVTVKDTIEYKKIDVTDEVKKETEINAAKEDTAIAAPVESVAKDTVEWVESTKTPLGGGNGSVNYEQVNKADVPEPSAKATLERIWTADPQSGAYLMQDTVKLEQNAALSWQGAVKLVRQDGYFTEETRTKAQPAPVSEPADKEPGSESAAPGEGTESGDGGESRPTEPEPTTPEPTTPEPSEPEPEKPEFKVTGVSIEGGGEYEYGASVTLRASVKTEGEGSLSESDYRWSGAVSGTGTSISVPTDKAGTFEIKLQVKDQSATTTVRIKEKEVPPAEVTGISITANPNKAEVGKSVSVEATVSMSDGSSFSGTVNWSVNNGATISVDKNRATVTAGKAGKVTVSATAGNKTASTEVEFTDKPAQKVSVTLEAPGSIAIGEKKFLKCTTGGDVASVKWSISNTKIALIDENEGKVKGVAVGKATVKVKVTGKGGDVVEATGELTVTEVKKEEIKLDPSAVSMIAGEKRTVKAILADTGLKAVEWKSSDESIVKIVESKDDSCTFQALKQGKATITATGKENKEKKGSCEVNIILSDGTAPLKDKNGNQLYYKTGEEYKEATAADYYKYDVFYRKRDMTQYLYTGWQNIEGKRYYFDKNGNPVTGDQVILGMQYSFNSDGSLKVSGAMGIDVSKHNGNIDWNAVKNAGVDYVIIRCGYRGSATGVLVEDQKFRSNIQGAQAAGLKVGIYFFSQAVNDREALEEASLTIDLIRKYNITYPVYMDVEAAGGRADGLNAATRTQLIRTFCETLRSSGYTAGVYANKNWLSEKMSTGALGSYKIWLAQYAATPTYGGRYEMWQYSKTGKIPGISGSVDLNISYMSY